MKLETLKKGALTALWVAIGVVFVVPLVQMARERAGV